MFAHLRAIGWLLVLTLLVCCVVYPLALWAVGQGLFPSRAGGSLVVDEKGQVRGSRLLAQPFSEAKYFRPRPSAVGYNAAASGGSNLAASNPLLRDSVARRLGPITRFGSGEYAGQAVGPHIEKWFAANPGLLRRWAAANPKLAGRWVNDDDNKEAARDWLAEHHDVGDLPPANEPISDTVAVAMMKRFSRLHPRGWPVAQKAEGKTPAHLVPKEVDATGANEITDLQGVLFDLWLAAHPREAEHIEKVPADLVTTSGSGLEPHITWRGARYQLDRVVEARAKETGLRQSKVRSMIEGLMKKHRYRPLGGLVSEPLVNVVELNRALDAEVKP
jgi:K+-transporting ATPase ATPase C chain